MQGRRFLRLGRLWWRSRSISSFFSIWGNFVHRLGCSCSEIMVGNSRSIFITWCGRVQPIPMFSPLLKNHFGVKPRISLWLLYKERITQIHKRAIVAVTFIRTIQVGDHSVISIASPASAMVLRGGDTPYSAGGTSGEVVSLLAGCSVAPLQEL